jgi:hypothetical protein
MLSLLLLINPWSVIYLGIFISMVSLNKKLKSLDA